MRTIALPAKADPPLPTFGSAIYNITTPMPAINNNVPASVTSTDNSTAINAYIAYCSTHGGGTVEIPAGTFLSGTLTMKGSVNLQIDSNATLKNANYLNTLIQTSGSSTNMEISGSGVIDGSATTTVGSTKLVSLSGVTTMAVVGVSIENAANEHLAVENDTNVTLSNVTIADPGTLAANKGAYLANTDGVDYWGSNFLIKNCNISDGDDNIVAKTASGPCSNISITGCTIGAGHGISVGGGSAHGLSGLTVSNCTFNGTTDGLRLKAQDLAGSDAGGGTANPVQNVNYSNISMTNVADPIVIDSFYNGSNNFPTSPTGSAYPSTATPIDTTTPVWRNISFNTITATGSSNAGLIYGLKTSPYSLSGLSFANVNIQANSAMNLWYADSVDLSGLKVTVPTSNAYYNATPVPGVYAYGLTNLTFGGSWQIDANGNWSALGNWSGQVPGLAGSIATFGPVNTAPRTITMDVSETIGTLNLNSPISYTIAGSKSLSLASVNVSAGSHSILAPVIYSSGISITTSPDPSPTTPSLTLPLNTTATGTLTKSGLGTLAFAASVSGITVLKLPTINVTAGTIALESNPVQSNRTLLSTGPISIASGQLDAGNNDLDLQGAGVSAVSAMIQQGFNGGNWNGSGITSSYAASDQTHLAALAVIQNNQSGSALFTNANPFDGTTPGASDVLVKFTDFGDANLDGVVDGSDYTRIDSGYLSQSTGWFNGDFNYDGVIDGSDYTLIDNAFNHQQSVVPSNGELIQANSTALVGGIDAVPDPAAVVWEFSATLALLGRRSRKLALA